MNADSYGDALDCTLKEITKLHKTTSEQAEEITKIREQVATQAAVIEALRAHLKVIAGLQLCADNLMSNSDIAAKALAIPADSTQILEEVRREERESVIGELTTLLPHDLFVICMEAIRAME